MTKRFAIGGLFLIVTCILLYVGAINVKPKLKPLFSFLKFTSSLAPANQPQDRSWVDSMPVSMNGQVDESLIPYCKYRWHGTFRAEMFNYRDGHSNWQATYFYDDPLLVNLCQAISSKDIPTIESLIAAGADVNKIGKEGMTPLLWAFVIDDDPRPFGCLLKHGANPNVINHVNAREQGWRQVTRPGLAVVHMVARGTYNRHYKTVFENGGDPNLKCENLLSGNRSPLQMISYTAPDAIERLQLLINNGAKLNARDDEGHTFVSSRARYAAQYEMLSRLVLEALKSGADFQQDYIVNDRPYRLIHFLAESEANAAAEQSKDQESFKELIDWLEDHGESIDKAREDIKRWNSWSSSKKIGGKSKFQRNMDAEIAARKARVRGWVSR